MPENLTAEELHLLNTKVPVDEETLIALSGADDVEIIARGDEERDEETKQVILGVASVDFTFGDKVIHKSLHTKHIAPDDALREMARWAKATHDGESPTSEPTKEQKAKAKADRARAAAANAEAEKKAAAKRPGKRPPGTPTFPED